MTQRSARTDDVARALSAYYSEIVGGDEDGGVSLCRFMHFLAHYRVLSMEFTHQNVLEIFTKVSGGDPNNTLDMPAFRAALTAVAQAVRGAFTNTARTNTGEISAQPEIIQRATTGRRAEGLEELLHEINLRRDSTLDHQALPLLIPIYDAEVIQAVYAYGQPLRDLYYHYAASPSAEALDRTDTNSSSTPPASPTLRPRMSTFTTSNFAAKAKDVATINGRSLHRFCRAINFIPDIIVAGELADVVAARIRSGHGKDRGDTPQARAERHAERRYLEEGRMFSGGEDQNWTIPARGVIQGEPRYNFPDFVEVLVAASFALPPRPHDEPPEVRAERIHDILGERLRIPCMPREGLEFGSDGPLDDVVVPRGDVEAVENFSAARYLDEVAKKSGRYSGSRPGSPNALPVKQPGDLREILVRLSEELPPLPEKQGPRLPMPPPDKVEELRPQPTTADGVGASFGASERSTKAGKKKGAVKEKKAKVYHGPIPWDQVQFYAKRPPPRRVELPPQWNVDRRCTQMEELDMRLFHKRQEAARLAAPEGGWALRLALIDEPLRAPRCQLSEEVSTLMETALTARRLRHYEEAIALLVRARWLWAALEAGRMVPYDWADVQPMVPAPSPWGTGMFSAAGTGGQALRNATCSANCRHPVEGPKKESILTGNDVFRRLTSTCASAQRSRRPVGAVAAAAAAAGAGAGAAGPSGGGGSAPSEAPRRTASPAPGFDDMAFDQTILPSDMRRDISGVGEEGGTWARSRGSVVGALAGAARAASSQAGGAGRPSIGSLPDSVLRRQAVTGVAHGRRGPDSSEVSATASLASPLGQSPAPPASARVDRTSRPGSASRPHAAADLTMTGPATARAATSSPTAAAATAEQQVMSGERRYVAKEDFWIAAGDYDNDLARLPPEAAIFFYSELASLHVAVREDDCAAQLLWRARRPSERLPANHPDTAVVWCGLGRIAYLAGAFDVAARVNQRARCIRERTLGGDTVETATSYNNLACSLVALDRPLEALAYLELAEELLRVLVGEDHPRSQTALRNLDKVRSMQKHLHCEVPHIFSYLVRDHRLRGRSRRKKKKKGGGSSKGSKSEGSSSRRSSVRRSSVGKSAKARGRGRGP